MASSERKRKHRQMRELGWEWAEKYNQWEFVGGAFHYICHNQRTNKWVAEAQASDETPSPSPSFDCYLSAALWIAVEVSNG